MSISIVDGNVPYYGIYGNKAQQITNLNYDINNSNYDEFNYTTTWTISLGKDKYYMNFSGKYLYLYQCNPSTYLTLDSIYNSDTETLTLNSAYRALQPVISIDLFYKYPYLKGSHKNCSLYLYDNNSSSLFMHIEYDDGNCYELVVLSSGYIQLYTPKVNQRRIEYQMNISKWFDSVGGCSKCYQSKCEYYENTTRTSCKFGSSVYRLDDSISESILTKNTSGLLTFNSNSNKFEYNVNKHLEGLNFITKSDDVLCIKSGSKISRIPLKSSFSKPAIGFKVNDNKKYINMSSSTSSQPYNQLSPLNLCINNSIVSPKINRTSVKDIKQFTGYKITTLKDITIYTEGSSTSRDYRYFTGAPIFTFENAIRVSSITIIGCLIGNKENELPNSKYSGMFMHINSSTSNISNEWTSNNTKRYEFKAGYSGSNGGIGQVKVISISHSGYIKQFAFTPSCLSSDDEYGGHWQTFSLLNIILTDYYTGESFIYNV